jgi:two-component system LytT family sensor kinase
VTDDGAGVEPDRLASVLSGAGGGIGLSNVDARLRATFGEKYALQIESRPGNGTTVVMTVPNLGAGARPTLSTAAAVAATVADAGRRARAAFPPRTRVSG